MNFDPAKPARIKSTKQEVRFIGRVDNDTYPLVYGVKGRAKGYEVARRYTAQGRFNILAESPYDLENVPENPKKVEGWINYYKGKDSNWIGPPIYATREEADRNACTDRKACIFISFHEENGL